MRVLSVVGARPNFAKLAPVHRALAARRIGHEIVHTGQHYDANLSDSFFAELEIPRPGANLEVGSGSHHEQTAKVVAAFGRHLERRPRPDWVLVYGDVNSTAAAALVAAKMGIRVAHVEAGLRSGDRTMPEELNRIVADHLADLLFATTPGAARNLRGEGIPPRRIRVVGNTMLDTLAWALPRARRRGTRARLGLPKGRPYLLLTLHRPSNVDDPATLRGIWKALGEIAAGRTILFPVHPRTFVRLRDGGLLEGAPAGLRCCDPLGYHDFVSLMHRAEAVLTDSGGIQDETAYMGVPCVTLRWNTERPETLRGGRNRLVGNDPRRIHDGLRAALRRGRRPLRGRFDDGRAAVRIVRALLDA